MRDHQVDTQVQRDDAFSGPRAQTGSEPSLGELLKRLTTDTGKLIGQEVKLAKAEAMQAGTALVQDGSKIAVGFAVAFAGSLALMSFLVIGLGSLLGGNFWLSSLIVGVAGTAVGMTMAKSASRDAAHRLKPQQTIDSVKETVGWAKEEVREMKHDLTNDNPLSQPRR